MRDATAAPSHYRHLHKTRDGSVWRAVEPLGEFDDQAFGSADVAEEEGALEVDDLPDRFPAGLSDSVDDATHVVDLEGDVPKPRTVRGRRRLPRAARAAASRATARSARSVAFASAPCWARTSDPQLVELVLSQLS